MKLYLWQALCTIACIAMLATNFHPSKVVVVIAGFIIAASCVLTYIGEKEAYDGTWWKIAFASLAVILIGFAG